MIRREVRLYQGVEMSIPARFGGLALTVENVWRSFDLLLRFGLCNPDLNGFCGIRPASGNPLARTTLHGSFGGGHS